MGRGELTGGATGRRPGTGKEAGDGAGEAGDTARGDGEGAGDGARSDEEEAGDGASSDGDKACGGAGRRRRGAGDDGLGAVTTTTNGLGASGANGSGWRNFHKCYLIYPEQWSRFVLRPGTNAPFSPCWCDEPGPKANFRQPKGREAKAIGPGWWHQPGLKGGNGHGWCHEP